MHVVVFVGVVDIVASAVVADVAVTEVVDVVVVVGAVVVVVGAVVVAVAVAVAGAGIDAGAAAVGSVVAFFAPTQRPSKRTHRGPSNRFDLPSCIVVFGLGLNLRREFR